MSSKETEALQAPAGEATTKEPPAQLTTLAHDLIVRSKTNPRTHFDASYIEELADSIRQHGILQPILVRPLPASRLQDTFEDRAPGAPLPTHEIVCGECRWRACGMARAGEIPVLIRHLDDIQVLQVQLVENLRRKDLHPLEEAEGFDRLMKDHGMSVEDIAAKVNKSASQIYVTLKLLELTPECREELYAGKLNRSTALLVARAPAYLQVQIAKDIMKPDYQGDTMSYREAVRHIQQHYMLQLSTAVFDIKDASLVAKAGDCTGCKKRTGANSDLFEDVKVADTCTDPKCFDAKKVAHYAQVAKAAEAKGQKVIQGKEAKELIAYEGATPKGYQLLDEKSYINGTYTSLRKVLGKDGPTPVIFIEPFTKQAVEALPVDVANKLIKKADSQAKVQKKNTEPSKRDLEATFEESWHDKAVTQIHAAIMAGKTSGITVGLARHIAMYYAQGVYGESADRFARLFNVPSAKVASSDGIDDFLKTCPDAMVGPALLMLMVEDDIEAYGNDDCAVVKLLAVDAGVDLKALQDEVKAEMKEAAAARKAETDAKASKGKKPATAPKPKKTSATDAKDGIAKALQAADAIKGLPGVNAEVLQSLTAAGVLTMDDLADLTVDELSGITCLTEADARAVITRARENWFNRSEPSTAAPAFKIGDRVRFKQGLRGPAGMLRKVCGREGLIDRVQDDGEGPATYGVRLGNKPSDYASANADELELVSAEPAAPITVKPAKKKADKASPAATPTVKPQSAWPFPTASKS